MRLSVIIVNYNVCYFLEQCLYTVFQAIKGIEAEVIVIDNASTDKSRELLPNRFPSVQYIWNTSNPGFGTANNHGLAMAKGEAIVLLNPYTLLPAGIFHTCLEFLATHPDAGGLGMRMYDGRGAYLPESKRGWPGALTAFFKLSGLTAVFPRNQTIARYYLGHLSPDKIHPLEVLAGAFMVIPRKVYEKVGGFDEQFFMYGEDIDLSYRISQAGFTNYYLPYPALVHFKGESTIRNATNTRHFYAAMQIFVAKHFPQQSLLWKLVLNAGIKGREWLAKLTRREKVSGVTVKNPTWKIIGDEKAADEIRTMAAGFQIGDTVDNGCIYALGDNFGLQQVLEAWQKSPPVTPMRFHGMGTSAIVGSDDKNSHGEVVILKK